MCQTVLRPRGKQLPGDSTQAKAGSPVAASNSEGKDVEEVKHSLLRKSGSGTGPAVSGASEKAEVHTREGPLHPGPPSDVDHINQPTLPARGEQSSDDPEHDDKASSPAAASNSEEKGAGEVSERKGVKEINGPLQQQPGGGYWSALSGTLEEEEEEDETQEACSTGAALFSKRRRDLLRAFDDAKENEKELLALVREVTREPMEAVETWKIAKGTPAMHRLAEKRKAAVVKTAPLQRLHTRAEAIVSTIRGLLASPTMVVPDHQVFWLQHHKQAEDEERGEEEEEEKDEDDDGEEEGCTDQPPVGTSLSECGIFEGVSEQDHDHEDEDEETGEQQEGAEEDEFARSPIRGKGAFSISVGNLSTSTTAQDVQVAFESFRPCSCLMLTHHRRKPTRFAVLGFHELPQAANALRKIRHVTIDNHVTKVRAGVDGVESAAAFRRKGILVGDGGITRWAYQVFVGNLAWGVTSRMLFEAIEEHLHSDGTVQAARVLNHRKGHYWRGCPMGIGWVLLSSKADAKAVSFLGRHEVKIMGRAVHPGQDKIQCILLTAA